MDKNSGLNNFIIPAGGKRVVLLMADTTSALAGKNGGAVTMKASISGKKGWQQHPTDPKRSEWGNGGLFYHYTPVGGKEKTVAYTATDYYPVLGDAFTIKN